MNRSLLRSGSILSTTLLLTGCAGFFAAEPREPPRECETLDPGSLPALEALLDTAALLEDLRESPAGSGEVVVTVASAPGGEEIAIFGVEVRNEERGEPIEDPEEKTAEELAPGPGLGFWLISLRSALISPTPPEAAPGVRVRLVPGPQATVALEPPELCPARITNRPEVEMRYRDQMQDVGGTVELSAVFHLSELGGIRNLEVEMPEGAEEHELRARRALHFARFDPALVDGRAVPTSVRLRFPAEG